jgi:hypothetical protein
MFEVACDATPVIKYIGQHAILQTISYDPSVSLHPMIEDQVQVGVYLNVEGQVIGIPNLIRSDFLTKDLLLFNGNSEVLQLDLDYGSKVMSCFTMLSE